MSTVNKKCWSAEFLDALHVLERSSDFQHRVRTLETIPKPEFVVDVRKSLRSIWSLANQLGYEDQMDKAARYHGWVALPLRPMDQLFLYLGICIWIWAGKHSATWHVPGYILICCVSRQEVRSSMMVPVISVACRQTRRKTLFSCPCMQMCFLSVTPRDCCIQTTRGMTITCHACCPPRARGVYSLAYMLQGR